MLHTKLNAGIINSVSYSQQASELTVELKGKKYTYSRVEMFVYLQICKSLEPLKYYTNVVKGKYQRKK